MKIIKSIYNSAFGIIFFPDLLFIYNNQIDNINKSPNNNINNIILIIDGQEDNNNNDRYF